MFHAVAQVELACRHDVVVVGHEVTEETVEGEKSFLYVVTIRLVLRYDVFGSCHVRVRMEDLVQSRIPLGFVEEVDQLCGCHAVSLRRSNSEEEQK